jgi:hypothetical protein
MPTFRFDDFRRACKNSPDSVVLLKGVQNDADNIFNLRTKEQVLAFIANDGLESLRFVNSKPWKKNPDKSNVIQVDAYEFMSMSILGYIAFMYSTKTGKWLIKSFHQSSNSNQTMLLAFQKAQSISSGGKNE